MGVQESDESMTRQSGGVPSQRRLRVGEELRHVLVRILARGNLRDPELDGVQVTVTEVRVSPDLRNATAFVVPFGGGPPDALVAALNRAAGFFRAQFGRELKLRYVPGIRFEADRSFDHARRIDQLLHDSRVAPDLAHEDKGGGDTGGGSGA
jgi:ribosome-binding factor A